MFPFVEQAKQELSTNYKSRPNVNPIERENTKPKENKTELFVIASIVHAKDYAQINENVSNFLSQDSYKKAYEYVLERLRVNEKPQVAMLYTLLNEDDATEIANYEFLSGDNESKFLASIKELKLRYLVQEKERLSKQYDSTKDKNFLMKVLDLDSQINALRKGDRNEW